jgi:hypothetical protein
MPSRKEIHDGLSIINKTLNALKDFAKAGTDFAATGGVGGKLRLLASISVSLYAALDPMCLVFGFAFALVSNFMPADEENEFRKEIIDELSKMASQLNSMNFKLSILEDHIVHSTMTTEKRRLGSIRSAFIRYAKNKGDIAKKMFADTCKVNEPSHTIIWVSDELDEGRRSLSETFARGTNLWTLIEDCAALTEMVVQAAIYATADLVARFPGDSQDARNNLKWVQDTTQEALEKIKSVYEKEANRIDQETWYWAKEYALREHRDIRGISHDEFGKQLWTYLNQQYPWKAWFVGVHSGYYGDSTHCMANSLRSRIKGVRTLMVTCMSLDENREWRKAASKAVCDGDKETPEEDPLVASKCHTINNAMRVAMSGHECSLISVIPDGNELCMFGSSDSYVSRKVSCDVMNDQVSLHDCEELSRTIEESRAHLGIITHLFVWSATKLLMSLRKDRIIILCPP